MAAMDDLPLPHPKNAEPDSLEQMGMCYAVVKLEILI